MREKETKQQPFEGVLTLEEVRELLNYIVYAVRMKIKTNKLFPSSYKKSSIIISKLCKELNIMYLPINIKDFGMSQFEHNFGIMSLETEVGHMNFLIDINYLQLQNRKFQIRNINKKVFSYPDFFISEENKQQLVKNGYLTLTQQNFDDYISSFIESYKLINNIDERDSYDKLCLVLESHNIDFVNKDYLNNNGITY